MKDCPIKNIIDNLSGEIRGNLYEQKNRKV
jgi:hypothetical protein